MKVIFIVYYINLLFGTYNLIVYYLSTGKEEDMEKAILIRALYRSAIRRSLGSPTVIGSTSTNINHYLTQGNRCLHLSATVKQLSPGNPFTLQSLVYVC